MSETSRRKTCEYCKRLLPGFAKACPYCGNTFVSTHHGVQVNDPDVAEKLGISIPPRQMSQPIAGTYHPPVGAPSTFNATRPDQVRDRTGFAILVLSLLLGCVWILDCGPGRAQPTGSISAVRIGMSYPDVEQIMGKPIYNQATSSKSLDGQRETSLDCFYSSGEIDFNNDRVVNVSPKAR